MNWVTQAAPTGQKSWSCILKIMKAPKALECQKRGLYFLFAWLFGAFRRHSVTFSAFFWTFDPRGALHQKWLMCNQGWLCSYLKRHQSFIFASQHKNNNDLHMMLEGWGCKKDIEDHYPSHPLLGVGTTEQGRWQILRQLPFAIGLPGGAENCGNRNKRMGKISRGG